MASPNIQNISNVQTSSVNPFAVAYGGALTAGDTSCVLGWNEGDGSPNSLFTTCTDTRLNTYGSVIVQLTDPSSGGVIGIFIATGTTAGADTVTTTTTGAAGATVICLSEEPPSSGVRNFASASGSGTQPSISITGCKAGDVVVAMFNANGGAFTLVAGTVTSTGGGSNANFRLGGTIYIPDGGGVFGDIGPFDGVVPSDGTATFSVAAGSPPTHWSAVAVALKPAASGGAAVGVAGIHYVTA